MKLKQKALLDEILIAEEIVLLHQRSSRRSKWVITNFTPTYHELMVTDKKDLRKGFTELLTHERKNIALDNSVIKTQREKIKGLRFQHGMVMREK